MVVTKRKKVTKYRAHTTHGGGHRKKRRGAGSRGGRGRAGTGKRAGHKKAGGMVISGKHGFRPRRISKVVKTINLSYFTANQVDLLVKEGKATKEGDTFIIDLASLGYTKLLGTGATSLRLKLHIAQSSARAEEKVKGVGGEVVSANSPSQPSDSAQVKSDNQKDVSEPAENKADTN